MRVKNQNQGRVNVDHFSMVPRADIPRSTFRTEHTHKTTHDGGQLVPILVEETLPGDSIHGRLTLFTRLSTLLFPVMDHITAETFFFFVPARLVWSHWRNMMGERPSPSDSISYTVPTVPFPVGGSIVNSLHDYMGVPGGALITGAFSVNSLPMRAYNLIWNEWFRDENIQNPTTVPTGDGPDTLVTFQLKRRNKRHDYFTSALPWPVKNNASVTMPLSGNAPLHGLGFQINDLSNAGPLSIYTPTGFETFSAYWQASNPLDNLIIGSNTTGEQTPTQLYADLSQATGATINALRLAFQTQRLLERDARSGTRYTELLRAHFGVMPEDARLQRPEYIGGGRSSVQTDAIPQTSATTITDSDTPLGALGATGTITGQHHFKYDATEHGYILGLMHVDAELTYQQGLHRLWTRQTRYDFYWPVFAHLGEQAVRNDEIFLQGTVADTATFGYQERWAEYRHRPSRISGYFRSTRTNNIDEWHLAQEFGALPTLSDTFIRSDPPFVRVLAAGSSADGLQFLADMLFQISTTRAMPMYSVPGHVDRF